MVRQYVDTRRPAQLVLLDTSPPSLDPEQFEVALEIVASLVVAGAEGGYPVLVAVPDGSKNAMFSGRDECLDRLAGMEQSPTATGHGFRSSIGQGIRLATSLIMVAGVPATAEMVTLLGSERRFDPRIGIRVGGEPADPASIAGAIALDVATGGEFASSWNSMVARL